MTQIFLNLVEVSKISSQSYLTKKLGSSRIQFQALIIDFTTILLPSITNRLHSTYFQKRLSKEK